MTDATGILLVCVSGIILGSFLAPMKRLKHWAWENFWVIWSAVALLIGPSLTAALSIPHVMDVYGQVSSRALAATILVGVIAGTSGFLYSRSVPAIGFGLATALDSGSGLAVGSLIPLFSQQSLFTSSGVPSLVAITIAIVGIWLCAKAGSIRESKLAEDVEHVSRRSARTQMTFLKGVTFSVVAGSISSCINLGLVFQGDIANTARAAGVSEFGISNAFLAPYLFGGFLSNVLYAGFIVKRNKTLSLFRLPGTRSDWFWSVFMGLLFAGAIAAYSGGVVLLGPLGTIVGWGLKTVVTIAISSLWDLRRGEWNTRGKNVMLAGVGILIVAVLLLATAQAIYVPHGSR